jgi:phosphate starvation-inducible PhoH-like protein
MGMSLYLEGKVERLIFCRPAVEAGERLGFLPGDMQEKIDPYLRPIYDALHDMMPWDEMMKKMASGDIEVAPLAFMRGRTLSNAFVILDEAQNTTCTQMKMFLTRMGEASRMVITGDLTQTDLPPGVKSGLRDAVETLETIDDIYFMTFAKEDVIRHPLVSKIVHAYSQQQ